MVPRVPGLSRSLMVLSATVTWSDNLSTFAGKLTTAHRPLGDVNILWSALSATVPQLSSRHEVWRHAWIVQESGCSVAAQRCAYIKHLHGKLQAKSHGYHISREISIQPATSICICTLATSQALQWTTRACQERSGLEWLVSLRRSPARWRYLFSSKVILLRTMSISLKHKRNLIHLHAAVVLKIKVVHLPILHCTKHQIRLDYSLQAPTHHGHPCRRQRTCRSSTEHIRPCPADQSSR